MTTPNPTPSAEAINNALAELGIDGSGAAEQAWRSQLGISTGLAQHLQSIADAVGAAKRRAESALAVYTETAPSAAEIEAAQQELLAASTQDDPRNPQRLAVAEDKLGELLARQQHAEDTFQRDSADNVEQLDADRKSAEEELSPEARAKLAQLLGALAGPPGGAAPAGAPAGVAAGPASAGGPPASGFTPMSGSGSEDSGFSPGGSYMGEEQPGQTHTASSSAPVTSQPTLVNASTSAQVGGGSAPVATSGPAEAGGQPRAMPGGFMPPMAPGMGMGAGGQNGPKREGDGQRQASSALDRDELLNGDDLLNRSVKGRI